MTTNFYNCLNCLDLFQAKDLTITEYITKKLEKIHMVVCTDCLNNLTADGVLADPQVE